MLNPIKRFDIGHRTPLIWKYPAPFDSNCSVLIEKDSTVIVWENDHIYKTISKHGISPLEDCPQDARLYFINTKEYPLIFNIKTDKGEILFENIIIRISAPETFVASVFSSKSIVTGATAEIHLMHSLNEAISKCHDNTKIETVNKKLKEKGFAVVSWRCRNDGGRTG